MGTDMSGDEDNTIADQFVRDCHGLLRVAGVVGDQQFNLLTEHAASRVYVGDGHLGAMLNLLTPENIRSSERTGSGNQDFCLCGNHVEHD